MNDSSHARRLGELVGGKYRVARFLAAGGMGVVYEAEHTVVKRRFAVKFLRAELADRREALTRFQREAQAAGALESENVAAAVDFGIAVDGSPYIVMEFLEGESLEALIAREGRLPAERAVDLLMQACRGVQAAHAAGIVHRDLKPQNLFVCRREDGTDLLKVLDFGIAKLDSSDSGTDATRTGTVLGTPAYMAPEQARGEKAIDQRADVHALGAILYELLSGEKPHPGASHHAILHHIATQPAVPLHSVRSGLPAQLVSIVEQALASEPSARPSSADALARQLDGWARPRVASAPRARSPSAWLLALGVALALLLLVLGLGPSASSSEPSVAVPAVAPELVDRQPLPPASAAELPVVTVVSSLAGAPPLSSLEIAAPPAAVRARGRPHGRPGSAPPSAASVTFDSKNPYE